MLVSFFLKQKVGNGPRELSHTHMFKGFMKKYNKAYNSQSEFKKRFSIFRQNLKKIHILQQSERGTAKYGPTKFSDLTGKSNVTCLERDHCHGFCRYVCWYYLFLEAVGIFIFFSVLYFLVFIFIFNFCVSPPPPTTTSLLIKIHFCVCAEHEFRRMLGLRPDLKPTLSQMEPAEIPSEEIPSAFDWRDHGIVTPVKNQVRN